MLQHHYTFTLQQTKCTNFHSGVHKIDELTDSLLFRNSKNFTVENRGAKYASAFSYNKCTLSTFFQCTPLLTFVQSLWLFKTFLNSTGTNTSLINHFVYVYAPHFPDNSWLPYHTVTIFFSSVHQFFTFCSSQKNFPTQQ